MFGLHLNGLWQATDDLGAQSRAGRPGFRPDGWREISVPGHWQELPGLERFTGRLLYRRAFDWPEPLPDGMAARLRFDGIFTAAKVWLNGQFLGEQTGYFLPASYEVTRHLRTGENVVLVEVESLEEPDPNARRQVTGIYSHWHGKPPLAEPGGIWRDVVLEVFHGLLPERLSVRAVPERLPPAPIAPDEAGKGDDLTAVDEPPSARIAFDLELTALREGRLSWTATITPETFAGEVVSLAGTQTVRRGRNRLQSAILLNDPHFWWTWDHGRPDLYRFALEIRFDGGPVQRHERILGVAKVELRGNHAYLNGRRIFLRGSSYPGPSLRPARASVADYHRDLNLARSAHINLVRVFGHVAKPEFYEEASRQGILLWQDFPLYGLMARSASVEAKRQAEGMVELLAHWPAIGLWCAHADPSRKAAPGEATLLDRSLSALEQVTGNWNSAGLATAVRDRIKAADPQRPALAHPNDWGGLLGGAENRLGTGWTQGKLADLSRLFKLHPDRARFPAEFGADSFPVIDSSRRFVRGTWPDLNWKELQETCMLRKPLLQRRFSTEKARSLEEYIAGTQADQAELIKRVVETLRRMKHNPCGGMIQHWLTDVAPGVTGALLDCWREPKPAYETLKLCYSPVFICAEWPQASYVAGGTVGLRVYLINDTYQNHSGRWRWQVSRRGESLAGEEQPAYLPPDRVTSAGPGLLWTIPADLGPGPAELLLELSTAGRAPVQNRYLLTILPKPT